MSLGQLPSVPAAGAPPSVVGERFPTAAEELTRYSLGHLPSTPTPVPPVDQTALETARIATDYAPPPGTFVGPSPFGIQGQPQPTPADIEIGRAHV